MERRQKSGCSAPRFASAAQREYNDYDDDDDGGDDDDDDDDDNDDRQSYDD